MPNEYKESSIDKEILHYMKKWREQLSEYNLLHLAVKFNRPNTAKYLIEVVNIDVLDQGKDLNTALHLAVAQGDEALIFADILMNSDNRINLFEAKCKRLALHEAVFKGSLSWTKKLISYLVKHDMNGN